MVGAVNWRAGAALLMLAWALCAPVAAKLPQVDIETAREGALITVTASAVMQVDARTVWSVISDYDHLAEFIPDMRTSRVVRQEGNNLLVDQTGTFGFLFFQQAVEVRLAVVESPPRRIVARAVAGNLKEMEGLYAVEALPGGAVRLHYSGRLEPEFLLPSIIGRIVLRRVMAKQFTAIVVEILRRDAIARGPAEPR